MIYPFMVIVLFETRFCPVSSSLVLGYMCVNAFNVLIACSEEACCPLTGQRILKYKECYAKNNSYLLPKVMMAVEVHAFNPRIQEAVESL